MQWFRVISEVKPNGNWNGSELAQNSQGLAGKWGEIKRGCVLRYKKVKKVTWEI